MHGMQGQRFCVRRANPFRGVVAVVESSGGRALSLDGRHWNIEILAHPPRGLWSGQGHREQLQYFRFGLWSQQSGLKRVPFNPILDVERMLAEARELMGMVEAALTDLPFPLAAELELWQLDPESNPLALLAAAVEGTDLETLNVPPFSAGATPDRPFVSAALERPAPLDRQAGHPLHHARLLEQLVDSAGGHRDRQWFRREADGTGIGVGQGAPSGLAGRRLSAKSFPVLPLRTDWSDARDRALVADWIDWIAPYLLTLPGIDDERRGYLEGKAALEPLLVDALWPLYPRVVDRGLLDRVRVEARLIRASGAIQ